jgi:hypothetical protein
MRGNKPETYKEKREGGRRLGIRSSPIQVQYRKKVT